jgi:hypothetical protein
MKSKRLVALAAVLPLVCAPSALAATSITDGLSADQSAVEVTSEPAGTTQVHIAVMSDLAGDAIRYLNIPASQTSYTPPPGTPVVDVQAFGSQGAIGAWAGRLATTPGGIQEEEAQEVAEEAQEELSEELGEQLQVETRKERRRKRHRVSREEKEAQRKAHEQEEASKGREEEGQEEVQEGPAGKMVIGVDSGGWGGRSTFTDLGGGGIRYIRTVSGDAAYVEPEASAAGVHIATLIFGTGGTIGAINASAYAAEVRSYFARYGLAGGLSVELLNEPGNSIFWSDPTDYAAYARLAKAVHEALATLPASSRPAELCSWDGGEASPYPNKAWGQGIKAAGALPYCDGVTVHPYGGKTGGDGGALGGHKDVELAHSESNEPVYVTELGWPTAQGQPPTGDSQQWTEAQQASNITGFMQWASSTGYVPMVIYFNYVDYGSNDFYGIETKEHKHKLGFAALAQASAQW